MTRPLCSHTIIPHTNIRFLSLATFRTSTAKPPVTINALSALFTKQTCSSPTSHPIGHKTQHKAQHRHICIYQVCKTTSRISIHACTTCSLKSVDYSTYCTHHTHHSYLAALTDPSGTVTQDFTNKLDLTWQSSPVSHCVFMVVQKKRRCRAILANQTSCDTQRVTRQ